MKNYKRKIIQQKPVPRFKIYQQVADEMTSFARYVVEDLTVRGHILNDLDYQEIFWLVNQRLNTYIADRNHQDLRKRKDD